MVREGLVATRREYGVEGMGVGGYGVINPECVLCAVGTRVSCLR